MKEVIKKEPKETIHLYDINNDSIVGIHWTNQEKAFIRYCEEGFCGAELSVDDVSSSWSKNSVGEYVDSALKDNARAFVFNTYKELFNWLES